MLAIVRCVLALASLVGWLPALAQPAAQPPRGTDRDDRIEAMQAYLAAAVDAEGWFAYRRGGEGKRLPGYNIVRHAGTILAMSQALAAGEGGPQLAAAVSTAARRLDLCCVRPVSLGRGALAVWRPARELSGAGAPGADKQESAPLSLGATALGLIALIAADRHGLHEQPVERLRALGRFLLAMQREDGSFRSRWFADGRPDDWRSLYYPGEAALALLWLAAVDPSPAQAALWRRAAVDALLALATERRDTAPVPADHWALIATGTLACLRAPLAAHERNAIEAHAWQIARSMWREQLAIEPFTGGFVSDERITPTATRLEGLLALGVWPFAAEPASRIAIVAGAGVGWLVKAIPASGAVPRHRPGSVGRQHPRHAEVRIDYVQHALSALLLARARDEGSGPCGLLLPPPNRKGQG